MVPSLIYIFIYITIDNFVFSYFQQLKADIRRMWYLEYEIADLQEEFAKEMGSFDTQNMTVDFIEDMLIKSKPLQTVLLGIRRHQKVKIASVKIVL